MADPRKPATTPQSRENQLIAMAVDLAEKQMLEGTASAQVITHYLKLGSSREKLEQQRIEFENKLVQAKTELMEAQKSQDAMYEEVIVALRRYSGQPQATRNDDYED